MIPIVGYMAAYNEAEYIEYAIRSTIEHVDVMIVIEGAFKETVETGGSRHSDDGTLEILSRLKEEFGQKLQLVQCSPLPQLNHRNIVFQAVQRLRPDINDQEYWLWIIDADEVYDEENATKLQTLLQTTEFECIKVDSMTFVNDFQHWVRIAFPRCFLIQPEIPHYFSGPNHIVQHYVRWGDNRLLNDFELNVEDEIKFWHYSYVKAPERFTQKKKERTRVHGSFKWYLGDDDKVTADGVNIREYHGEHPEVMRDHPRMK